MNALPMAQQMQDALRFYRRGGAPRMLLDKEVTQDLDVLYRYAVQLAGVNEHGAAARLFKLLTLYDAWSFEYWFQLGVCCQTREAWSDAVYAYGRAAQIRLDAPEAPLAAAECYLACHNLVYAKKALRATLLICGNASEHHVIRQRAEAFLSRTGDGDEHEPNSK